MAQAVAERRRATQVAPVEAGPGTDLRVIALFCVVALALFIVMGSLSKPLEGRPDPRPLGTPWLDGWLHWDAGWYESIASRGYFYEPGAESSTAFFPAYPLLMRAGREVVGDVYVAGIVVTFLAGLGAVLLLWRWARDRLSPAAAWTTVLLVVLYPYAFFLVGTVYADALFLVAVTGAFVLLERGHPVLAGLAGAVATATRPVGLAVTLGLAARTVERRSAAEGTRPGAVRDRLAALRPADAGVLLSLLGFLGYAAYLWARFGDPFSFLAAQEGWGQKPGASTWFKVAFFENLQRSVGDGHVLTVLTMLAHPVLALAALALVPLVFRRFGWGYGTYTLLVIAIPLLGTRDFFGMARYVLAAFPCFAVAGELLTERRRLRALALVGSGIGLLAGTSMFSRAYYIS